MVKNKIRPAMPLEENIQQQLERLEKNKLLIVEKDELKELLNYVPETNCAMVTLPNGKQHYIIMKEELRNALFDPSADDIDVLRKGRDCLRDFLIKSGGKLMIKESVLERSVNERYISSLIMNIIKYPEGVPFIEKLEQLGFYNENIRKKYEEAAIAWAGKDVSFDFENFGNYIEKVNYTGGDCIGFSVDKEICEEKSHYVLNIKTRELLEQVNKKVPKINENCSEKLREIVEFVQINAKEESIKNNALNLVIMVLNIFCLFKIGKPFPIE